MRASRAVPAGSTAPAAPAVSAAAVVVSTAAEAVCMAAEAATAAADTGNSPRIIQQSAGTAGSRCCQPFFIVRKLFLAVGNNPILHPVTPPNQVVQGPRKTHRPVSPSTPTLFPT